MEKARIAVVGGGALGGAVLKGLQGSPYECWLVEPDANKRDALLSSNSSGLTGVSSIDALPTGIELLLIVVKPGMVLSLAPQIAKQQPQVVVSLAAGVPAADLRQALGPGATLYRGMMSTAAAQRMTTTTLCPENASTTRPEWLAPVFETLGEVIFSEERLLDAIMTLSASAPAFFLSAAEGLADGGVRLGLDRALAERLALGAMRSAYAVANADAMTPAKYRITSPGGVTIEGLAVLERMATKAAFSDAAVACVKRTAELLGSKK